MKQTKTKKLYPIVLFNSELGMIQVVYKTKTMRFNLKKVETKKELDPLYKDQEEKEWSPQLEVDMCINNGFKRIRDSENALWNYDFPKKESE